MKELLEILSARAARPALPYALATVVKVEGSSYRKPGARMLIGARGRLAGSVSGGCLERDVVRRGLAVLLEGKPQVAVYDTTDQDDVAFGASLGCEGRIEIFIEPVPPDRPWPLAEAGALVLAQPQPSALALVYRGETAGALVLRAGEGTRAWPSAAAVN
jgi:xanthine/CO dehydrogenase XdhC/CoxF family maturation factor